MLRDPTPKESIEIVRWIEQVRRYALNLGADPADLVGIGTALMLQGLHSLQAPAEFTAAIVNAYNALMDKMVSQDAPTPIQRAH